MMLPVSTAAFFAAANGVVVIIYERFNGETIYTATDMLDAAAKMQAHFVDRKLAEPESGERQAYGAGVGHPNDGGPIFVDR